MFITEQHIESEVHEEGGKRVFHVGMRLANPLRVKARFTYKELTLVLGIFVAMIVAITIWANRNEVHVETGTPSSAKVIPIVQSFIKKTVSSIDF